MLYKITSSDQINKRKLMDLYYEGNLENTDYFYPEISDKKQALEKVEKDFLHFIDTVFFSSTGNSYWVLEEQGVWISALRINKVDNTLYYLEALETHPNFRRQGYASSLLNRVIEELKKQGPFKLCDCVSKKNTASVETHRKCGFTIVSDAGINYLSGEADESEYGMQYSYCL